MVEVENFVSRPIQRKVKENIIEEHNELTCKEVQPKNSEFEGRGEGRCVFEKRNKIVKIPYSKIGVAQMGGVRKVFQEAERDNKSLAMPLDIAEGEYEGTAMVQEEAEPIEKNYKEDEFEGLKEKFKEKHFNSDTNIICRDWSYPENLGTIEGKGVVLTDLGECDRKWVRKNG